MTNSRLVFHDKAVEWGLVPGQIIKFFETLGVDSTMDNEVDREVRKAIEGLDEEEMEFVIRFYFMGQSYQEICKKSGRRTYKLEALHKRAVRKLKSRLKSFVKKKYGVKTTGVRSCPICLSPNRAEIDEIINKKSERSSWRPVLREIRIKFGLKIKSPMVLIGHVKYHGPLEGESDSVQ